MLCLPAGSPVRQWTCPISGVHPLAVCWRRRARTAEIRARVSAVCSQQLVQGVRKGSFARGPASRSGATRGSVGSWDRGPERAKHLPERPSAPIKTALNKQRVCLP